MTPPWRIERIHGSAAAFHGLEPGDAGADEGARLAWWCVLDAPALVLGSAQREATIDREACRAAGIDVVRRRSGGGAVLVIPSEVLWLDVVVPRDDPLWHDDVGRSMWWFGELWASALRTLGVRDVSVHEERPVATAWSPEVCFDGVGAGEVLVGGAKAVGISQRRTRGWARLQSAVHVVWRAEQVASLLAEPRPSPGELRAVWSTRSAGVEPDALASEVGRRLP